MKIVLSKCLTFCAVLYMLASPAPLLAATIAKIGSNELVNDAELIFEGVVTALNSEQASNGFIYTYVSFRVDDIVVGSLDSETLVLRFMGGTANGITLDVGAVYPELNERGIYFVEQIAPGLINPLLGWTQGHFKITRDNQVLAGNDKPVQSISGQSVSELQISQNVAEGISTEIQVPDIASGMSVRAFKQEVVRLKR